MHAAYVKGTSARNSWYIFQGSKKACSSSIAELYKHFRIFKNTQEEREALAFGSACSFFSSVHKKFPRACMT